VSANRRQFGRVRTSGVAALLQIDGSTTSVVIDNISLGGVFLRSARPMSVGTRLQLRIVRPGLKIALGLYGRVVGVLDPQEAARNGVAPGMHIQFEPVDEGPRDRLSALLVELGLPPNQHELEPKIQNEPDPFAPAATVPGIRRPSIAVETLGPGPSPSPAAEPPASVSSDENPFLRPANTGSFESVTIDENPFVHPAPSGDEPAVNETTSIELTISRDDSAEDEAERLMTHVRGLMLQLSESEQKIAKLEQENRRLKARLYDLEHDDDD
jgi:hypothetical protein